MTENTKSAGKEIIINAASIAFGKYGYKKTTLDDIASIINKRKTLVYYYFKNKDEIFQEVIKTEAQKLKKALMLAVENEDNPIEKLKIYVFTRMNLFENIGAFYSALKNELYEHLQFINQNRTEFDNAEYNIVYEILNEGMKKKCFDISNINETTLIIITTLKSLEIPFFGREEKVDYQTPLMHLLNMLLYGIVKKNS